MKTDSSPLMTIKKRAISEENRFGTGFNTSLADKKSLIQRESFSS